MSWRHEVNGPQPPLLGLSVLRCGPSKQPFAADATTSRWWTGSVQDEAVIDKRSEFIQTRTRRTRHTRGPSVRIAFTIDDLPLWPQSYPPVGYTAEGIVDAIRSALQEHGIHGVYAFSNSWPLEENPEYAKIFDDWVADGHHVANHTHSHVQLPDVTADAFIADIDAAEHHLRPWLSKAPLKLFRHPLCHWGDTARKLEDVNAHLRTLGLMPVDVTSWAYEWTWNRAYRNALDANDADAVKFVKSSFLDFSAAQLRHDMAAAEAWFGGEIVGIALGHNVPFFADIAMDYFSRLKQGGGSLRSTRTSTDRAGPRCCGVGGFRRISCPAAKAGGAGRAPDREASTKPDRGPCKNCRDGERTERLRPEVCFGLRANSRRRGGVRPIWRG